MPTITRNSTIQSSPKILSHSRTPSWICLNANSRDSRSLARQMSLIAPMCEVSLEDQKQYLVWRETRDAFWAFEYYFLFARLARDSLWWKAVGYCENPKCQKFFIRQRADNRFDSDKCRQNVANRKFYQRRARSHGGPT